MNYVATIGEREVKITVEELGGSNYKVTIDGVEHVVDARRSPATSGRSFTGTRRSRWT